MKLSQLEKMVAEMKVLAAKSQSNKDPEVRFCILRSVGSEYIESRDSYPYITMDINTQHPVGDNRIIAVSPNITAKTGDYEIMLDISPFYKEAK